MFDFISPFYCLVRQTASFPFYPSGKKHSGVDYVPINQDDENNWRLYSVCDGVLTCHRNDVYGNYVVINNKDLGIFILYAHLDSFSNINSRQVKKGDFIGIAGNTGNSTGRHLHLEVFRGRVGNKLLLNPDEYIPFNGESVVKMWQNGSTPERLYSCVEHAYYQYDDVFHLSIPPRKEGNLVYVASHLDSNIYCVQFSLGTGTCIGYVKYRGGV